MNLRELIKEFRRVTDDLAEPYFWTDPEIIGYANQAEQEACRRALLLSDTAKIKVRANNPIVALIEGTILVRRVRLIAAARNLRLLSWRRVEEKTPNWEDQTGAPFVGIPDWISGAIRLHPVPIAEDTAAMNFYRLPNADMASGSDCPEIDVKHHFALVDHMLELGYGKHDADCFDPNAAAFHAGKFTAVFGPPASAVAEAGAERDVSRSRHSSPL